MPGFLFMCVFVLFVSFVRVCVSTTDSFPFVFVLFLSGVSVS